MKKIELKRNCYDIAMHNKAHEVYSNLYSIETTSATVLVDFGSHDYVKAVFSKRTGTLYVFTMRDAGLKNKIYAFARKVKVTRIAHLYFRKDCVLETYIDGRSPWKAAKDIYYREYHNDFNTQIQNRW